MIIPRSLSTAEFLVIIPDKTMKKSGKFLELFNASLRPDCNLRPYARVDDGPLNNVLLLTVIILVF